jgi:hypothetical protein
MVMRLRQPNRRGFRSPIRERRKRQREYYYAAVSVLVVKIILLVFLSILFAVSAQLFHYRFPHLTPALRYAVPALVAIFAFVLIFLIYKNIRELKEISDKQREG